MNRLLLLFLLCFLYISCQKLAKEQDSPLLARVSNQSLRLDEALLNIPEYKLKSDSLKAVREFIDQWIETQVILLECERLNLESDPIVQKNLKNAQNEVLVRSLEESVLNSSQMMAVSEEEIIGFYQDNPELFILQEEHVVFDYFYHSSANTTANVRERILRGQNILDVISALKNSDEKTELIQKHRKFLSRSEFNKLAPPRFKNRSLSIGDISDVYKSGNDHIFLRVVGLQSKGSIAGLDNVKERIKDWLRSEKHKKNLTAYRRSLYLKAQSNNQIEVFNP